MKALILGLTALAVTAGAANAGTPWIKHRQQRQLDKIAHGIASGRLTAGETAWLLQGQARVAKLRALAKANDGVVGPLERLAIHNAQTRQAFRIYRLKHN